MSKESAKNCRLFMRSVFGYLAEDDIFAGGGFSLPGRRHFLGGKVHLSERRQRESYRE